MLITIMVLPILKIRQWRQSFNRAVLFDPSVPHISSLCDNRKRRVTVNFNYF